MSEQAAQGGGGDFPGSETVAAPGMGNGKVSEVAGALLAPAASDYPALPDVLAQAGFAWWMVRWDEYRRYIHEAGYRAAWRAVDRVYWALSDGAVRDALWALPDQAGSPLGHPCGAPAPAYDVFIFVHGQCAVNLASEACLPTVRFPATSPAQPSVVRERAYRRLMGGTR